MDEKSWKEMLFGEPLEPPKLTPEEAFEAGKRGDLSGYDAAGRKCARLIYEVAQKNCKVGCVLGKLSKISKNVGRYLKEETAHHQVWQDWFLDMDGYLSYVFEKEAPEIQKMIDEVGPTGFMWGWAVQAAIGALKEDGYFDQFMWPKRGHLTEEGTCPRCHIPIQTKWKEEKSLSRNTS